MQVCFSSDREDRRGYKTICTGGPLHPYGDGLWPIDGIGIGYGELKIIECYDFMKAVAEHKTAIPDFKHGLKISIICDAVAESNKLGEWIGVDY